MKLDPDFSLTERALIRLYRRSAPEGPSDALDARILARSRAEVRRRGTYIPLALAASLFLAISAGFLVLPRTASTPPSLAILTPWVPFEGHAEPTPWPAFQKYRFLKPAAGLDSVTTLAVLDDALSSRAIELFPAGEETDTVGETPFQPVSLE